MKTVHDVLWRTIDRKGSEARLPPAVSAAQLANVEEVAPAEVDESRNSIERLAHAEAEFTELVETGSRLPWRGVQRADLSPVEVQATVQLIAVWDHKLADLQSVLCANGLCGETITIREAGFVHLGAESVQRMSDALDCCDLASLSRKDTRDSIARAAVRARRLREIGDGLIDRFGMGTDELPQGNDLHALAAAAVSLGVSAQSAKGARTEARSLRERAEERDRIDGVLARLAGCFEFVTPTHETLKTMVRAVDLLRGADADLRSSRTTTLMTLDARRILDRVETECRELKQTQDDLAKRFDLASLPSREELQQAARSLNAARGPLLFDRPAKRAMRLHRELSLVRSKPSTDKAARDLRELIEYREQSVGLAEDDEIKALPGHRLARCGFRFNTAPTRRGMGGRGLRQTGGRGRRPLGSARDPTPRRYPAPGRNTAGRRGIAFGLAGVANRTGAFRRMGEGRTAGRTGGRSAEDRAG